MQLRAIVLVLALTATPALAGPISPSTASARIGQQATVEGVVSEVFTSRRGDTFIDLGGRYPNEQFTGIVFRSNRGAFDDLSGLEGKTVDIAGTITAYRGRAEIILRSPDQLKVK